MFMHRKISLMGFDFQKTIVASDLDIEDIDIFFGPNDTGKSNYEWKSASKKW